MTSDKQLCKYCRNEMKCSLRSYEENPFCTVCLPQRIAEAVEKHGPGSWMFCDDGYMRWVPVEVAVGKEQPPTPETIRVAYWHPLPGEDGFVSLGEMAFQEGVARGRAEERAANLAAWERFDPESPDQWSDSDLIDFVLEFAKERDAIKNGEHVHEHGDALARYEEAAADRGYKRGVDTTSLESLAQQIEAHEYEGPATLGIAYAVYRREQRARAEVLATVAKWLDSIGHNSFAETVRSGTFGDGSDALVRELEQARTSTLVEAAKIASGVAMEEQAAKGRRMGRGWEALLVAERIREAAVQKHRPKEPA